MTHRTQQLLSENNIYISWGIFMFAIILTGTVARTMLLVDQLVSQLPAITTTQQNLKDRITKLETLSDVKSAFKSNNLSDDDIKALLQDRYNVEIH